ncbi:MAG: DUF4351 domain-containing protein [Gammaproteobacteria bacterium]|nr:DUF4351 domain-containing protein [Gammaproteobacteria bacterium]
MANVSHDQNFKNLIVDYPRDALAFFAAEEAPEPGDDVQVVPLRQEQLKERLGDRFRELDAPVLVHWADGRRDAVLFVVEEETQPRRFSPYRLAHYCLDLAQMYKTDRVVPVTIFLRGTGAAPESLALGTERNTYLAFRHLAFRLAETPYEDWRDSGNVAALVNLPNMRVPAGHRVDAYADALRGLAAVETDLDKRAKYMEFIDAYAGLNEDEYRRYERDYAEESTAMAGAIQRARDEGRQEGTRTVLERQLQRRFGLLSPRVAERLRRASADDLATWVDRVLDANSLDEVFRPSR